MQKHMLTVDALSPEVAAVRAGIGFDSAEGNEVQDSSSLLIVFENEGEEVRGGRALLPAWRGRSPRPILHPGRRPSKSRGMRWPVSSTPTGRRALTRWAPSLAPRMTPPRIRTTYASPTPASAKTRCPTPAECIDTRNRVYVVLTAPMADDATAEVQILSGAVTGPSRERQPRLPRRGRGQDSPDPHRRRRGRREHGRTPPGPGGGHPERRVRGAAGCFSTRHGSSRSTRRARSAPSRLWASASGARTPGTPVSTATTTRRSPRLSFAARTSGTTSARPPVGRTTTAMRRRTRRTATGRRT